jgi:hypothetical protein
MLGEGDGRGRGVQQVIRIDAMDDIDVMSGLA